VQQVVPTLRITDYFASRAFYERMGFVVDWEHRFKPDFPVFMQISRDGMSLFLTQHSGDCTFGALVHIYVSDVDAWYAEFELRGVPVESAPNEDLPGLRSMMIHDPDGNKIAVHTRLKNWKRDSPA
jgi:catechol 2,3-dioxygenase-like lactoylglutathione lyase family enzyme